MKHLLIIYPHWPPSNLVGVHRVRLIANELVNMGIKVTVLTVDERDYEEPHDLSSLQLADPRINIVKVRAKQVSKIFGNRAVGDIGLRAFFNLKHRALKLCREEGVDCAWISIPSWYPSLIGQHLHRINVPFGIDYQDPWVHKLHEDTPLLSRARFTVGLARILEPAAVRSASFITGINEAYFAGTIKRNPHLKRSPQGELQLGFSHRDHGIPMPSIKSPWDAQHRVFIYAGAYLPLSSRLWKQLFLGLQKLQTIGKLDSNIRFYFFGTGTGHAQSLRQLAETFGLASFVHEHRERIPFLHVQELMRRAEGVLSVGSVEPHYSASKIFQCLLSGKKLFSFFHEASEARTILKECKALNFHCDFVPTASDEHSVDALVPLLSNFFDAQAEEWSPELASLEAYSAERSAEKLIQTFSKIAPMS